MIKRFGRMVTGTLIAVSAALFLVGCGQDVTGVNVDETYFLGGLDKTPVLKAFGAHIFFDDQRDHAERAAVEVPAAQVLWSEEDLPSARPPAKAAVVTARGRRRREPAPAAAKPPRPSPRGAPRPADRSAPGRSGR